MLMEKELSNVSTVKNYIYIYKTGGINKVKQHLAGKKEYAIYVKKVPHDISIICKRKCLCVIGVKMLIC